MFRAGDRVGAAVSGGSDSTALLLLLDGMKNRLGITLSVVHLNHGIRGGDADADECFVNSLARSRELDFISERVDVAAEAKRHKWNVEDAGRRLRQSFFERVMAEHALSCIAVAHTADDQAETVLARVLRGSGVRGLAGILPVKAGVVRPLIETRRESLRRYLQKAKQAWREDETNWDATRMRSRIRHRLLPEIETNLAPAIVQRFCELARIFHDEEAVWSALIDERFKALVRRDGRGMVIRVPDLLNPLRSFPAGSAAEIQTDGSERNCEGLERALERRARAGSRRLVLRILDGIAEGGQFSFRHIEEVLQLASKPSSGHRIDLAHGVRVRRDFDCLLFSLQARPAQEPAGTKAAASAYEYVMSLASGGSAGESMGEIAVPAIGARFSLKLIDWPSSRRETRSEGFALDAGLLRPPLVLRNWRPGDAYRPSGHRHRRKLKEFFALIRVPANERRRWPVLTSAGTLVWARRMPAAAEFAAGNETRKGLLIEEHPL
jgi:tRNA(Ile)-lysidine synthase